jgi:type IV pilus assembly protein PilW
MANTFQKQTPQRRQKGLSLVEILVGVLIGMIGIVVIFQVLAVSEKQKRNTTGGAEAQSAGALALFSMQEDLQLAGYGLGVTGPDPMGCIVAARDATRPGKVLDFALLPVEIVQPGQAGLDGVVNNNPVADEIRVLYGNSALFVSSRTFSATTGTTKTMDGSRAGFNVGDKVIFVPTGACPAPPTPFGVLTQVTCRPDDPAGPACTSGATGLLKLEHDPAASATYPFNDGTILGAFGAGSGFAFNLGPVPHLNVWRVTTAADAQGPNRLIVSDTTFQSGPVIEVSAGIVDLQAEYGVDANGNNVVEDNEWTETTPAGAALLNVRAIRVAVLARSEQWDKSASATDPSACSPNPQWTSGHGVGALQLKNFAMTNLDGSAGSADCSEDPPSPLNWRRYRYRVYETVVPLRNMIWGTAP